MMEMMIHVEFSFIARTKVIFNYLIQIVVKCIELPIQAKKLCSKNGLIENSQTQQTVLLYCQINDRKNGFIRLIDDAKFHMTCFAYDLIEHLAQVDVSREKNKQPHKPQIELQWKINVFFLSLLLFNFRIFRT